jgi:hypothetical protein
MIRRTGEVLFDRISLRGIQLFWPVVLLPILVGAIDLLKANPSVVIALLVCWGLYLLSTYGSEGWGIAASSNRSSLDLSFHLTQGIAGILLPIATLGAASLGCKCGMGISSATFFGVIADLLTLSGVVATVLMFFLFVPATAAAFVGSSMQRLTRAQAWQSNRRVLQASCGGVSLTVLMVVVGCCSIVASMQFMYRFVVTFVV